MQMMIETYEAEELSMDQTPAEQDAEALKLIEELGLEGQQSLVTKKADGRSVRCPYPELTASEVAVYKCLYPEEIAAKAYKNGPIPVRVLQVIGHARELFDEVLVWGPKSFDPDPVLVGRKGKDSAKKYFLLARWGEALQPYHDLAAKAVVEMRQKIKTDLEEAISTAQGNLTNLENLVRKKLRGEWVYYG